MYYVLKSTEGPKKTLQELTVKADSIYGLLSGAESSMKRTRNEDEEQRGAEREGNEEEEKMRASMEKLVKGNEGGELAERASKHEEVVSELKLSYEN